MAVETTLNESGKYRHSKWPGDALSGFWDRFRSKLKAIVFMFQNPLISIPVSQNNALATLVKLMDVRFMGMTVDQCLTLVLTEDVRNGIRSYIHGQRTFPFCRRHTFLPQSCCKATANAFREAEE